MAFRVWFRALGLRFSVQVYLGRGRSGFRDSKRLWIRRETGLGTSVPRFTSSEHLFSSTTAKMLGDRWPKATQAIRTTGFVDSVWRDE